MTRATVYHILSSEQLKEWDQLEYDYHADEITFQVTQSLHREGAIRGMCVCVSVCVSVCVCVWYIHSALGLDKETAQDTHERWSPL